MERPRWRRTEFARVRLALGHRRLAASNAAAMREVRESRARIAVSAERERRRIERDLHDGAQQRLIALRIELGLAEELALRDPAACAGRLRRLEHEIDAALDELRALAHGLYPPLLADRGLVEALDAIATQFPLPVTFRSRSVVRYAPEIESAVYFCVLEALQNVLKHADGASAVEVTIDGRRPGLLRFDVRDDGCGTAGDQAAVGAGITNMGDRLAAVGGELAIASNPPPGTLVAGRVPIAGDGRRSAVRTSTERRPGSHAMTAASPSPSVDRDRTDLGGVSRWLTR